MAMSLPTEEEWKKATAAVASAAPSSASEASRLGDCVVRLLQYASSVKAVVDTAQKYLKLTQTSNAAAIAHAVVDAIWLQSTLLQPAAARGGDAPDGEQAGGDGSKSKSHTSIRLRHDCVAALIKYMVEVDPSCADQLIATLDAQLLAQAGIVASEADMQKKVRLLNTQLYYRQDKFNLLVEQSEGYAKYLTLLTKLSSAAAEPVNFAMLWDLIGTFRLDPNRCLDLVVDVVVVGMEQQNKAEELERYVPLLVALPNDQLPKLLGFKLQGRLSAKRDDVLGILHCMAWLVEQGRLAIADMLAYLPQDWQEPLASLHKTIHAQNVERVKAMGKVRLGGDGIDAPVAPVDRSVLSRSVVLQWLNILAQRKVDWLGDFQRLWTDEQWSHLCLVLPETLGASLCDWVHERVKPFVPSVWPGTEEPDAAADGHGFRSLPFADTFALIEQALAYTRAAGCIQFRPQLYIDLCRVLRHQDMDEGVQAFLKSFLLPSLSTFAPSPAICSELWLLLQRLSYPERYRLYTAWYGKGIERSALRSLEKPLWQIAAELQGSKDIRYHLKRLAKDTIRDTSRAVAKICHQQPLVVFTTILNQIEAYDNMIQIMIDSLRFITPLALDVLGFCVLSRMRGEVGGVNRNRLKEDGINVSQWLQSLETFTGALYKKYPFAELRGILNYLISRLKDGHVMELGVLRTLLKVAGGWAFADYSPAASLSSTQLRGRAGTVALKRETMSFGVIEDSDTKASTQVRRVLQSDSNGVVLLILLAQLKHQVVFAKTGGQPKPIKLIGNLVDTCQVVMAILLDFLTVYPDDEHSFASIRKFAESLPNLTKLHEIYKLDVAASWMMCRPLMRAANSEEVEDDGDAELKVSLAKFDVGNFDDLKTMLPTVAWSYLTPDLFRMFQSYAVDDLLCPEEVYNSELSRLEREAERLQRQLKTPVQSGPPPDRSSLQKGTHEAERLKSSVDTLAADIPKQKERVFFVRQEFKDRRDELFRSDCGSEQSAVAFMTYCIYPRCMLGPDDALYCAQFITMLHDLETPGFSTLQLLDCVFLNISRALFGLTEGEAANVSILFFELWTMISRWRYSEEAFQGEVSGKPGAVVTRDHKPPESLTFKDFEDFYNKWHAWIGATALGCLKSKEYMHTRNCLIVLTRLVDVYPTQPGLGNKLLSALEPWQAEDARFADIRASAQAYSVQLAKARDEGVWTEEDEETKKARLEKDQAAAAVRQKRAAEQMEEIKRESEKITDEIGEWDGARRDRRRDGVYQGRSGEGRDLNRPPTRVPPPPPPPPPSGHRDLGPPREDMRRIEDSRRNMGRLSDVATVREDRRAPTRGNVDRDERWLRDREGRPDPQTGGVPNLARRDAATHSRDEAAARRNLEGRWVRPDDRDPAGHRGGNEREFSAGTKRSRPSSPEPGETSREEASKRPRLEANRAAIEETSKRSDDNAKKSRLRQRVARK